MSKIQKGIKVFAICLAICLIVTIFSWGFYGISWLTGIRVDENQEDKITFSETYQNIENVEIEVVSANIIIQVGSEWKVEAKNMEKGFSVKNRNQTLKIEEKSKWFRTTTGEILITVPENMLVKEFTIDTGAGKFEIDGIQVQDFEMEHGAGLLEMTNVTFYEADIDGGAGEIKILDSSFQNIELDAGIGKVEMEAEITGQSKIECGVGEIELTLLGSQEDYRITTEKGIGEIQIDGKVQENNTVYGTGTQVIELKGGIGSIEVFFSK